mmetsp:Transcript_10081/g.19058  ORF Transcript_10081/g.19058 Transcript_10081/m.19058 type:complete len:286 (-) Transcript_10081:74-931(-)
MASPQEDRELCVARRPIVKLPHSSLAVRPRYHLRHNLFVGHRMRFPEHAFVLAFKWLLNKFASRVCSIVKQQGGRELGVELAQVTRNSGGCLADGCHIRVNCSETALRRQLPQRVVAFIRAGERGVLVKHVHRRRVRAQVAHLARLPHLHIVLRESRPTSRAVAYAFGSVAVHLTQRLILAGKAVLVEQTLDDVSIPRNVFVEQAVLECAFHRSQRPPTSVCEESAQGLKAGTGLGTLGGGRAARLAHVSQVLSHHRVAQLAQALFLKQGVVTASRLEHLHRPLP